MQKSVNLWISSPVIMEPGNKAEEREDPQMAICVHTDTSSAGRENKEYVHMMAHSVLISHTYSSLSFIKMYTISIKLRTENLTLLHIITKTEKQNNAHEHEDVRIKKKSHLLKERVVKTCHYHYLLSLVTMMNFRIHFDPKSRTPEVCTQLIQKINSLVWRDYWDWQAWT